MSSDTLRASNPVSMFPEEGLEARAEWVQNGGAASCMRSLKPSGRSTLRAQERPDQAGAGRAVCA